MNPNNHPWATRPNQQTNQPSIQPTNQRAIQSSFNRCRRGAARACGPHVRHAARWQRARRGRRRVQQGGRSLRERRPAQGLDGRAG
eukprot:1164293-Prymnesium_polylepis.1